MSKPIAGVGPCSRPELSNPSPKGCGMASHGFSSANGPSSFGDDFWCSHSNWWHGIGFWQCMKCGYVEADK